MIRKPCVAGQFYPGSKAALEKEVMGFLADRGSPREVIALISPHAGYVYSGQVAGAVFSRVVVPGKVIVLSPNHTGFGAQASIMPEGEWETPLGNVKIDRYLAKALMKNCGELKSDVEAHLGEHSLEVQLPFMQVRHPGFEFVPVTLSHLRFGVCESIGKAIAKTIRESREKVLIVASSDMTHYEPYEQARAKDMHAIDKVLALDPRGLVDVCGREKITMCGVVPSAIALAAAIELGAKKAELVRYATSGDVSGDRSSVVGYAGMIVY